MKEPAATTSSPSRIYLVGMMGAGKTTLGKKLAKALNYAFIDLDEAIEKKAKRSVASIFREEGEAHFRQLEHDALLATGRKSKVVIATGGGAACFHNHMHWMNERGLTIYIKASQALLYKRLRSHQKGRPALAGLNAPQLKNFIREVLDKRKPYYEEANLVIKPTGSSVKTLVNTLISAGW